MTNDEIIGRIDAHEQAIRFHIMQIRKLREQYNPYPTAIHTNITVEALHLSVRAAWCLQNQGIETLGQLLKYSAEELLKTGNFGKKPLYEIRENLEEMGLYLRGDKQ